MLTFLWRPEFQKERLKKMPMSYKMSLPEGERDKLPLEYVQVISNALDDVITINLYSS